MKIGIEKKILFKIVYRLDKMKIPILQEPTIWMRADKRQHILLEFVSPVCSEVTPANFGRNSKGDFWLGVREKLMSGGVSPAPGFLCILVPAFSSFCLLHKHPLEKL